MVWIGKRAVNWPSSTGANVRAGPFPRSHSGAPSRRVATRSRKPSPSTSTAFTARVCSASTTMRSKRSPVPAFQSTVSGAPRPASAMSMAASPSRSASATPAPLLSNGCRGWFGRVTCGSSWRMNRPEHAAGSRSVVPRTTAAVAPAEVVAEPAAAFSAWAPAIDPIAHNDAAAIANRKPRRFNAAFRLAAAPCTGPRDHEDVGPMRSARLEAGGRAVCSQP